MTSVRFIVPAVPVAQPRIKAAVRGGHAMVYTPKHPVDAFKACVRMAFKEVYTGTPLDEPIRCDVEFVFPRPKSMVWRTRAMPRVPHTKKPDRDNCDKAVMDALTGPAWRDDALVCAGEITKWIAAGDEQPHALITISTLEF